MKKITSILLIMFSMVLIVLLILLIILSRNVTTEKEKVVENYEGISFEGISNISKITQDDSIQRRTIIKTLTTIFETGLQELHTETQGLSAEEISNYYEENIDNIKLHYFRLRRVDFIKLCVKLNMMSTKLDSGKRVCEIEYNGESLDITCNYSNEEKLVFNLSKDKRLSFVQ